MRGLAIATASALAISTLLSASNASPAVAADVRAVAQWSMVPQAKDTDGDGIIDGDGGVPRRGAMSLTPSRVFVGAGNRVAQPHERLIDGALSWYLSGHGFPVRLDACDSTGSQFRWQARSEQKVVVRTSWKPLKPRSCATRVVLPEADYALTLEVRAGATTDTVTVPATVRNILVVALGDSYASGEGNPRNVEAWMRAGSAGSFDPYWDDDACHRSARGAPAQAALTLEAASPHTSVTLVDVSCSGARVNQGVLGAQAPAGIGTSQVEQARAIIGARPVDLVTISIGGNDVGFTSVLEACAFNTDCPVTGSSRPPLSSYPTVQDGVQAETGALAAKFRRIDACLGGTACTLADGRVVPSLAMDRAARVLPTLYPDITRAADGRPCSYLTIASKDFAWARQTILMPNPTNPYAYPLARGGSASLSVAQGSLNQQIAASAALPRWRPVTAAWSASGDSAIGHGVCAGNEAWAFGVSLLTTMPSASFHPNVAGQRAMAAAIAQAMDAAVGG